MEFRILSFFKSAALSVFLLTQFVSGADFLIDANLYGIFDNFENKFGDERSGTFFGTNTDLSAGVFPTENSGIFLGVNYFQRFGDENTGDFFPLVSYRFSDGQNRFFFGTAPHRFLIDYHDYILSKRRQFENPIFQGIHFSQKFDALDWAIWADWTGMKSVNVREEFIHGHNLRYVFTLNESNFLSFGWQFIYHHIAGRDRSVHNDHVEDVGAVVGNISYRKENENSRLREFRSGFRAMMRYNRQREFSSSYQINAGIEFYAGADFGRFDLGYSHYIKVRDRTHFPYDFVTGDDRFSANFGQLDMLVRFLDTEAAKVNFRLSFLPTKDGVNHRQSMNVAVPIRIRKTAATD